MTEKILLSGFSVFAFFFFFVLSNLINYEMPSWMNSGNLKTNWLCLFFLFFRSSNYKSNSGIKQGIWRNIKIEEWHFWIFNRWGWANIEAKTFKGNQRSLNSNKNQTRLFLQVWGEHLVTSAKCRSIYLESLSQRRSLVRGFVL